MADRSRATSNDFGNKVPQLSLAVSVYTIYIERKSNEKMNVTQKYLRLLPAESAGEKKR